VFHLTESQTKDEFDKETTEKYFCNGTNNLIFLLEHNWSTRTTFPQLSLMLLFSSDNYVANGGFDNHRQKLPSLFFLSQAILVFYAETKLKNKFFTTAVNHAQRVHFV
jgi:hypothetical protein